MLFYFTLRFAIMDCKGDDIADTIEPREESKNLCACDQNSPGAPVTACNEAIIAKQGGTTFDNVLATGKYASCKDF